MGNLGLPIRLERMSLSVGVGAIAICVAAALFNPQWFALAYLVGWIFWLQFAAGGLALLMTQNVTGGRWGLIAGGAFQSAARTMPFLAITFLPVLWSLPYLYPWAQADSLAADRVLQQKSSYLNATGFGLRALLYFAIWTVLAFVASKRRSAVEPTGWRLPFNGVGIVLYGLTITFASIDWVMSMEPHWYSSIYGVQFATSQMLQCFAGAILLLALVEIRLNEEVIPKERWRDLGNLLLAFVMLWAYMAVSQFIIVWNANLREEVPWYLRRAGEGWADLALAVILLGFFLPLLCLLTPEVKESPRRLAVVAGLVLLVRFADLVWLVVPSHPGAGLGTVAMSAAVVVALGIPWLLVFLKITGPEGLLPERDLLEDQAHG